MDTPSIVSICFHPLRPYLTPVLNRGQKPPGIRSSCMLPSLSNPLHPTLQPRQRPLGSHTPLQTTRSTLTDTDTTQAVAAVRWVGSACLLAQMRVLHLGRKSPSHYWRISIFHASRSIDSATPSAFSPLPFSVSHRRHYDNAHLPPCTSISPAVRIVVTLSGHRSRGCWIILRIDRKRIIRSKPQPSELPFLAAAVQAAK